jgi:hypothetical protein
MWLCLALAKPKKTKVTTMCQYNIIEYSGFRAETCMAHQLVSDWGFRAYGSWHGRATEGARSWRGQALEASVFVVVQSMRTRPLILITTAAVARNAKVKCADATGACRCAWRQPANHEPDQIAETAHAIYGNNPSCIVGGVCLVLLGITKPGWPVTPTADICSHFSWQFRAGHWGPHSPTSASQPASQPAS